MHLQRTELDISCLGARSSSMLGLLYLMHERKTPALIAPPISVIRITNAPHPIKKHKPHCFCGNPEIVPYLCGPFDSPSNRWAGRATLGSATNHAPTVPRTNLTTVYSPRNDVCSKLRAVLNDNSLPVQQSSSAFWTSGNLRTPRVDAVPHTRTHI